MTHSYVQGLWMCRYIVHGHGSNTFVSTPLKQNYCKNLMTQQMRNFQLTRHSQSTIIYHKCLSSTDTINRALNPFCEAWILTIKIMLQIAATDRKIWDWEHTGRGTSPICHKLVTHKQFGSLYQPGMAEV